MKKIFFIAAAALLAFTGCLKDEIYKGPSTIEKVVFTPEAPTSISDVTVTATVSGLQKVTKATLKYNGNDVTGSGTSFTGTIPAMADGSEVSFTVTVVNEADFTTVSDKYTYTVGDPATVEFVGILNVHDFVADVVGCLYQIDEWMTSESAVSMLVDA